MMKSILYWLLATAILIPAPTADAQQPTKTPRIGYLALSPAAANPTRTEAFRQGLREHQYIEGKNIFIEWRFADGKLDRVAPLAAELVNQKVEIIVTAGPNPTRAAKEATSTIPIVMTQDIDPVGSGLIASLAHPGGNITGLSTLAPELSGKSFEILHEVIPKLTRLAVFGNSTSPGHKQTLIELESAARAFKTQLQYLDILDAKDIESSFNTAIKGRADGILILTSGLISAQRKQVVDLAAKLRLPAIYQSSLFADAGGLMFYGVNLVDLDRRAATYVDKILKGAKPADLPVEQPMKFEFIVNLKAAKQIGLTIPPNVLVRADRVIR